VKIFWYQQKSQIVNIIVYAHSMEIGGSQLSAIEIGAAVQSLGHQVLLVAEDGELAPAAQRAGLEHIRINKRRRAPSLSTMNLLVDLVRRRNVDVVHGYEWPPVLDGWFGPHLRLLTPVVATVMSMAVAPFLPRSVPLVVGTERLREQCRADKFEHVTLIEPPVSVHSNSPTFEERGFRSRYGIRPDTILVTVVGRLARELKLEGLLSACRVIGQLARQGADVHLAIVGDGPARADVEQEAGRVNSPSAKIVTLTGALEDPRPAYAAANIILGMGGSALRGMAFAKPLIVQGEAGFWKLCDESTLSMFLDAGWYGIGDGQNGDSKLMAALDPLLRSPEMRDRLGKFGRQLVVGRFSLEHAAKTQLNVYELAMQCNQSTRPYEFARTLWGLSRHKIKRRLAKMWMSTPTDDFNALAALKKQQGTS
jgi:glycosyltransferase involved in cell wall biosynthesis